MDVGTYICSLGTEERVKETHNAPLQGEMQGERERERGRHLQLYFEVWKKSLRSHDHDHAQSELSNNSQPVTGACVPIDGRNITLLVLRTKTICTYLEEQNNVPCWAKHEPSCPHSCKI